MEGKPHGEEKGLDVMSVFSGNRHFAFVYRKTEKLVTAVYMITNFIKDNEPLKWKIRESALSLLALNLDWTTVSLSERRDLLREYQSLAVEIVSLSSVAYHSGLISEMNFNILSREFGNLASTIEKDENRQASEETVMLDPSFFDTREPEPLKRADDVLSTQAQPVLESRQPYKGQTNAPIKDTQVSVKKSVSPQPQRQEVAHESKDSRQATIVKLLSKKGGLGIKDFAANIKGVSEKTIQRELLAMVAAGVLKKEGERRWSTYSLA